MNQHLFHVIQETQFNTEILFSFGSSSEYNVMENLVHIAGAEVTEALKVRLFGPEMFVSPIPSHM